MHNSALHGVLEAFASDAAFQLAAETARGAEVPFEVTEERRGRAPLYCYRSLTGAFIRQRLGMLAALPSYAPAARALAPLDGVENYLRQRGEPRIRDEPRERADAALRSLLSAVFDGRSEFELDAARFETAYAELELALYEGRAMTTVIAPLLGLALDPDTREVPLGDGLSLLRGDALADAPADAIWGEGEEPNVLVVLTTTQERALRPPVSVARTRFRRTLTALRLFERGGYALGPVAWTRTDAGSWRNVALGGSGRPRLTTFLPAAHEDELRAFCNLISRRPTTGEVGWALSRYEMGCERLAPFEALTDYLLALRAMLEPEGPGSGRLAGRLAAICARPPERPALVERVAHAISLERAVIAGLAPAEPGGVSSLVDELAEHLRALLRDVLCGHLDGDLKGLADELLAEAAAAPPDPDLASFEDQTELPSPEFPSSELPSPEFPSPEFPSH
ncbi:MAG TPA: hypothetical protein VGI87_11295 [Solirubrobacteraceae bacterium]